MVRLSVLLIRIYQLVFRPFVGQHCRFYPSCSDYSKQALIQHGPVRGWSLSIRRIMRCHPWSKGGIDHIPRV
ncbi:MAG: membrane protein insertion efficiency factor YidD [Gammaproteobacteria bacterium]|nr:MAG: membrane protein insertion efficiency factor YidD [Gammaproteobacteria bacterium]